MKTDAPLLCLYTTAFWSLGLLWCTYLDKDCFWLDFLKQWKIPFVNVLVRLIQHLSGASLSVSPCRRGWWCWIWNIKAGFLLMFFIYTVVLKWWGHCVWSSSYWSHHLLSCVEIIISWVAPLTRKAGEVLQRPTQTCLCGDFWKQF